MCVWGSDCCDASRCAYVAGAGVTRVACRRVTRNGPAATATALASQKHVHGNTLAHKHTHTQLPGGRTLLFALRSLPVSCYISRLLKCLCAIRNIGGRGSLNPVCSVNLPTSTPPQADKSRPLRRRRGHPAHLACPLALPPLAPPPPLLLASRANQTASCARPPDSRADIGEAATASPVAPPRRRS